MICRTLNTFFYALTLFVAQSINLSLSTPALAVETNTPPSPELIPPPASNNGDEEKSPPQELRKPPVRAELQANRALAKDLQLRKPNITTSDTEIIWLGEGSDQYLGLYISDFSGSPTGNALILHDNQQHPDWPGLVHTLRVALPENGWSTLSISVPYFDVRVPLPSREAPPAPVMTPPPTDNKEADSTTGNEEQPPSNIMESANDAIEAKQAAKEQQNQMDTMENQPNVAAPLASIEYKREQIPDIVGQRIQEGLTTLQGKNSFPIIIIAVGLSATWTTHKLKAIQSSDINGLVIIDPVNPPVLEEFNIAQDIAELKLPILDIAPSTGQRSLANQRLRSAKRIQHPSFQQRILVGSSLNIAQQAHQVLMSVRGWNKRRFQP